MLDKTKSKNIVGNFSVFTGISTTTDFYPSGFNVFQNQVDRT